MLLTGQLKKSELINKQITELTVTYMRVRSEMTF